MNIRLIFFSIITTTLLFSCGQQPAAPGKEATKEAHHEEESEIVSLTDEQIKAVKIQLGAIEQKNLTTSVKVNGKLEVPNQNKASVTSLYSGVLKTLMIHPGSHVEQGQTIATVVNTDFINVQQELISVNARLKLAELEKKRQEELVAGNAAPLKNLQKAQADLSSLYSQQKALKQQLAALGVSPDAINKGNISPVLTITAPISGTISEIYARIGSKVDAATPVADIVNNSQLHLDLYIYEKDLPKIQMGQTIHFTLTNNPGKEYDARIFSVGTAFADDSKAIPIHAEVLGEKTGLIEGMSVTAIISIGTAVRPAVPEEAIVSNAGKDYIFIRTEQEADHHDHGAEEAHEEKNAIRFERIQVIRGTSDLGYTEISPVKELPANAQIITSGAFFVMAKMINKGEHEH